MAPEIIEKKDYDGQLVDVFATGVILFIIYTWSFPFENATPADGYYKYMVSGKINDFWAAHEKH